MSAVGCLLCWMGVPVGASCLMLVVEYCLSSADCYLSGVAVGVCCWFLVWYVGCRLLDAHCRCRSMRLYIRRAGREREWYGALSD